MIGLEEIRSHAMSLPEVTEGTHFNLPSFKVRDRVFVVLQKGATHAIVHVDQSTAAAAAADDPATYEVVWRNSRRIFVGVRVDLARAAEADVGRLVTQGWRTRAPRRLAARLPPER